ncbi:MAG: putative lipoprotein [Myxococcaceae bacterium]|nr:putative lipoprotein [Myxococcaceae bacterium]
MRLRLALGSSVSLISLAALGLGTTVTAQACGGDDAAQPAIDAAGDATASETGSGDAGDAGTDTGTPGIRGTLTVHVGAVGRVFLGDGSRFNQPIAANGAVTFTDPAIVGPQNVTFMLEPRTTSMLIFTLAKIDVPDVWFTSASASSEPYVYRATLKGNTSYPTDPAITQIDLRAIGDDGAYGSGNLLGPDPYLVGVQARKTTTTSVDLFGIGYTKTANTRMLRAGAVRNIGLPAFVPDAAVPDVAGPDLVLDHPFDQTIAITALNAAAYAPSVDATVSYYRKKMEAMQSSETFSGTSGQLHGIAMTAPFDTLTRHVRTRVSGALGDALVDTPLPANESTVTATFAMPATVTSPATTVDEDAGASTAFPPGSSVVIGNVDPAAQMTEVTLATSRPPTDAGTEFLLYWYVYLPRGETSFTFFELPPGTPERFFSSNSARLQVTTLAYKQATVAEIFGAEQDAVDTIRRTRGLSQARMARYFKIK